MSLRSFAVAAALAFLVACSPSEPERPTATATPELRAATATPIAPTPAPAATSDVAPAPAPTEAAAAEGEDEEEFEWDLADEPEDPNVFEIDADATSYYFPIPQKVVLKAKALNGKPPIKFRWKFGDGTPDEVGEELVHKFNQLGQISVFVFAEDAEGQKAHVNLILLGVTPDFFYGGGAVIIASPSPAASPLPIE